MRQLKKRYFALTFTNGLKIEIEPPKLKVIKKIMHLAKMDTSNMEEGDLDANAFEDLILGTSMALSKNKQNRKISTDFIEEHMNIDEIQDVLKAYFDWVQEIQKQKN